jgi:predicted DCC family thiol-disulfide oxidoreductase YuxK
MTRPLIVYDGDCIFCQNYTKLLKLRETIGPVDLLDARSGDPRVSAFQKQGYDLNAGMLFVHQGQVWHGSDAVHILGTLSSDSTTFNAINGALFSRPAVAKALYPFLRIGRNLTLLLRGKRPIQSG